LRSSIISYQDPFEDYKKRLAKKLEKQAAGPTDAKPTRADDVNWFGEKIGKVGSATSAGSGGSVGKYLGAAPTGPLKRSAAPSITATTDNVSEDKKKKRKLGFGDFDSW
ncbi:Peptidyl-prolyl cis-trans isomerase cyp8, partial [Tulasnella sp. 403]